MVCPKCGNEIAEGHLLCEVCGEEIRIVPDFDASLDDSINVSLSTLAGDLKKVTQGDKPEDTKPLGPVKAVASVTPQAQPTKFKMSKRKRLALIIVAAGAVFVLIVGIIQGISAIKESLKTYEDLYEDAYALYSLGDYNSASEILIKIDNQGEIDKFVKTDKLLADCYYSMGRYEESLASAMEARKLSPDDADATCKVIDAYIKLGDEESLIQLLKEIDDENILNKYPEYLADVPLFSIPSGEYKDSEQLTLLAPGEGEIHYTLDGTVPTEESPVYVTPFKFEAGEHTITAVFINSYGLISDDVQCKYYITKTMLDAPVLLTEAGNYSDPKLIELEKPTGAVIYYTDDGSDPTAESNVYNQPIPMPLKAKTYKFIMIDSNGIASEIIEASYSLSMVTLVDVTMAENAITYILTLAGSSIKQSEYKCNSAFRYNNKNYYLVDEYSLQSSSKVKTGRVYAVDVLTGELFKVDMSSATGDYKLSIM